MQVAQAFADTAANALKAYGSAQVLPFPASQIVGAMAAAVATAQGLAQIAVIKKQRQAARQTPENAHVGKMCHAPSPQTIPSSGLPKMTEAQHSLWPLPCRCHALLTILPTGSTNRLLRSTPSQVIRA